jgi:DNA polymerase I
MFKPKLPPIRSLIKPDPGWLLVDCDFDRADAQIVAWTADEPELKRIFQTGHDVHTENAAYVWHGGDTAKVKPHERQRMKAGVHLTNYGGKARTLAATLQVSMADAMNFQGYWFERFPGIAAWHQSTKVDLRLQHCVYNIWGFRRFYFDRLNTEAAVESLLPQVLAWQGQSGVAIAINHAMKQVRARFNRADLKLRLQVHDSLLLEVREELCPAIFPDIIDAMKVLVPFTDPLYIPVSLKWSAVSWGAVKSWRAAA